MSLFSTVTAKYSTTTENRCVQFSPNHRNLVDPNRMERMDRMSKRERERAKKGKRKIEREREWLKTIVT